MWRVKKFLHLLGPGLITGAADDDSSGIATYSFAGAAFGLGLLWTAWFTFPLMAAVQEVCARIGLVTKSGLARVIAQNYPRPVLFLISTLLVIANVFNIGADLSGMAAAIKLLLPVQELVVSLMLTIVLIVLMIQLPYRYIARIFKWLTLALFAYVLTFFVVSPNYLSILKATFLPNLSLILNSKYLLLFVAVFGTTISPYLFFWQASEEAEEEKLNHRVVSHNLLMRERDDTIVGMFFSNLVMFFIIAVTGTTLFSAGINDISTAAQAASALRPLAGNLAYLLFAAGLISTGILAIPVLAGSAAYAVAETFNFTEGLNKPFRRAKAFYGVLAIATILGFLLNLLGLNPIKYLFYSAVLNGLIAPVLIIMILLVANNKTIMGNYVNNRLSNLLSFICLIIMSLAALAVFVKR
ncbi:MAG: divalent metal cation transporter [Patescibacteria group bacterium]|nr:divalent metal cation transporter [Patescibacteria group bacterium]MCL5431646.1 divalent metal cation transporter [Patescibacteria group bacterium]